MGAIQNKSVDWSDSDTLLLGKSIGNDCIASNPRSFKRWSNTSTFMQKIWIGKAIVSFQTPEFSKVKRYKYFYSKNFESAKRSYRFKPQNFQRLSDTNTFMPKNLNRQSDCIVSNPRIFKGEAIHVLLCKKIWIDEAIVSFKNLQY